MKRQLNTILVFSLLLSRISFAQELNCSVQVISPQIQSSDKKIFETLQTAINEFMNNRKWTGDQFLSQERIECSILINVSERVSSDEFKATIQVQARRPVYHSSYSSSLFNYLDQEYQFRYLEYQPLEFSEQTFSSNLTSVLAFYAYFIIGLDYDSFSPEGGTVFFQKAMNTVNNAQNASEKGWKAFEGSRNRYWLAENEMNMQFKNLRQALYKYHRIGMDGMAQNPDNGRREITEALELVRKNYKEKPGALMIQLFFNAKADEIVNIYSQAMPDEKAKIINLLNEVDPTGAQKYQKILRSQ